MHLALCVDERLGLSFHQRRQSRDRLLCADWLRDCGAHPLHLHPDSVPLFAPFSHPLLPSADFLLTAQEDDYCFAEGIALQPLVHRVQTLVLYQWNRHYPADCSLDIDPLGCGFVLAESYDFAGHSHPCITKQIYRRSV